MASFHRRARAASCVVFALAGSAASADSGGAIAAADRFPQQDGAALYAAICQGCHMPDAGGAVGAGAYPALAADRKLESARYPVYLVVYGHKAMPGFGGVLADDQVATIVNYIRSHFGNDYKDAVTADDVKAIRRPDHPYPPLE